MQKRAYFTIATNAIIWYTFNIFIVTLIFIVYYKKCLGTFCLQCFVASPKMFACVILMNEYFVVLVVFCILIRKIGYNIDVVATPVQHFGIIDRKVDL